MGLSAKIFEVGLRDGLQSEKKIFSLEDKLCLLELLISAGLKEIEIGSFVRPDRIPQLADTESLLSHANQKFKTQFPDLCFWAFIPNRKGFSRAAPLNLGGASVFYSCSETFAQKNINRTKKEITTELALLKSEIDKQKIKTRAYLSTIVHCPYEGEIKTQKVVDAVTALRDLGFEKIALSDTTGRAHPMQIRQLLEALLKTNKPYNFSLHMHDTRALALSCVWEGMQLGIEEFDSSVAGLGGCPYAPGASGNLASEDLANLLNVNNCLGGIDLQKLSQAGFFVEKILGRKLSSKVLRSMEGENVSSSS